MTISLETVVIKYLGAKKLSGGTRKEYKSTLAKWLSWGKGVDVGEIERTHIRDFLDWVHCKRFRTQVPTRGGPRTRLARI